MLIPIPDLALRHGVDSVTGVLHLGAHLGEEADAYDNDMPWSDKPRVVWVEGNPHLIRALEANVAHRPGHEIIRALIDDQAHEVTLNIASNGQSSSVLEFGTHATEHPDVTYVDRFTDTTTTVDTLAGSDWDDLNFLNLDLQGLELRALRGAQAFLEHCRFIYSEVNRRPLYKGCAMVHDLDMNLTGFRRVATEWTVHGWGDALWVRR